MLIYGDTNSTLAGALAAAKLHIPVAHVEAGLRSFNMRMPEEVNRIVADRLSTLLFCPTDTAVANLAKEGISAGVENVGDVMFDVALFYRERARKHSTALASLGLADRGFALATCHRAENTDDPTRLGEIVAALAEISGSLPVVLPIHPRTRKLLADTGLDKELGSVKVVDPVPFLDMVALEQAAKVILTDSGGVQKEAFFYGVPCITMRDETEWVETVALGWNRLVGADRALIVEAFVSAGKGRDYGALMGTAKPAGKSLKRCFGVEHVRGLRIPNPSSRPVGGHDTSSPAGSLHWKCTGGGVAIDLSVAFSVDVRLGVRIYPRCSYPWPRNGGLCSGYFLRPRAVLGVFRGFRSGHTQYRRQPYTVA